MHDIDSTRLETSPDYNEYLEYQELNGQGEDSFEMPMTEAEEEALAAELLGVSNELEMDQFLGGVLGGITRGLGGAAKFLRLNAGPLSRLLKKIAARTLPSLGSALGTAIPIPGVGTALGSALGNAASNMLQSELEQMESEDQELELSKRFVRLASQAYRQAARIRGRANPAAAVNFAMRNALQRLRGRSGYRPRPIYLQYPQYAPCPPCPVCPTCAQALPAADSSPQPGDGAVSSGDSDMGGGAAPGGPGGDATVATDASKEFEFEDTGEFEFAGNGERAGEYYETDNEFFAAPGDGRSGQWRRHGRKIVLYL
jgi:hypothetical protein